MTLAPSTGDAEMVEFWITNSVAEDTPEFATFGPDTWGIVSEADGGVIAYVHRDNAEVILRALRLGE